MVISMLIRRAGGL